MEGCFMFQWGEGLFFRQGAWSLSGEDAPWGAFRKKSLDGGGGAPLCPPTMGNPDNYHYMINMASQRPKFGSNRPLTDPYLHCCMITWTWKFCEDINRNNRDIVNVYSQNWQRSCICRIYPCLGFPSTLDGNLRSHCFWFLHGHPILFILIKC